MTGNNFEFELESIAQTRLSRMLNLEHLSEISGGDRGFERDLVQMFLDSVAETVPSLREALDIQDWALAERLVHTLKGSAKSVGANEFADFSADLEQRIKLRTHVDLTPFEAHREAVEAAAQQLLHDQAA